MGRPCPTPPSSSVPRVPPLERTCQSLVQTAPLAQQTLLRLGMGSDWELERVRARATGAPPITASSAIRSMAERAMMTRRRVVPASIVTMTWRSRLARNRKSEPAIEGQIVVQGLFNRGGRMEERRILGPRGSHSAIRWRCHQSHMACNWTRPSSYPPLTQRPAVFSLETKSKMH